MLSSQLNFEQLIHDVESNSIQQPTLLPLWPKCLRVEAQTWVVTKPGYGLMCRASLYTGWSNLKFDSI
jgi:hypothetical protein